jgi:tetratricopeptide (TPR) repeat protein
MWWGDVVLAVGVAALLAFPVAARVAADAEPIAPAVGVALPPLRARGMDPAVRGLPVFISSRAQRDALLVVGGGRGAMRPIEARMRAIFGARRTRLLERYMAPAHPFADRLPQLPRASPVQENDLAALLIVTGASSTTGQPFKGPGNWTAVHLARALLEQAIAAGGGCAPQLNLAFTWAADEAPQPGLAERAYERAATACPGDPTPLWALGEFQIQNTLANGAVDQAPFDTFRRLQRAFPHVAASWAGEGDADMVVGYGLDDTQPFAARRRFAEARALYARAVRLQPNFENRAGLARALAALGDVGAAIATQRRAVAGLASSAELQARLLDYLQRGHRFPEAATVAAQLTSVHGFPSGVELFASPFATSPSDVGAGAPSGAGDEDVFDPLSTGVGVMMPAEILSRPAQPGAEGLQVSNLAFLPVFVPMPGIGASARWCPAWSRLVDLLLSRRPGEVVGVSSAVNDDLRFGASDCSSVLDNGAQDLAGVAQLELGNVNAAQRAAAPTSLADLEDLRQNLWRYAGNLTRAAAAAQQWAALQRHNPLGPQREGEVAFLEKRYNDAADYFAVAVNRARLRYRQWGQYEAPALLDQGTALAYARRRAEAVATLATANQAAARSGDAEFSAFAMEEAGDTALGSGHPLQARGYYAVAADAESGISSSSLPPEAIPLVPEALDNNAALADIATGDPSMGATLAAAAIKIDPVDPIFWWTKAEAEQRQQRLRPAAIADYRTSLALDPSEFPVANNLGVLLMQEGRDGAAVAALRRSVGANRDYATGWFNLGVALERMGPLHVLASEGSFARARRLDSKLASRGPVPLFDNVSYQSHLDLSKPLPANWTFASSQNHTPVAAAGLSAILVVAFGLARALSARATPGRAQRWFDVIAAVDRRLPNLPLLRTPALGIAATVAFLLWPLHSGPSDGWFATAVFVLGLLIMIAVVMRARELAATRLHIAVRQETWPPGVAFGLVITLVGAGWSPLPVARATGDATGVHWAGPTVVAALAIVLLVLATWLGVPLARSLGAAGLVMAASLLTPVSPIDGATVSTTAVGALPSLAVLGAAVLMLAGVL